MFKLFIVCLFSLASVGSALLNGELCGIEGKDFFNDNFTGRVAVAGNGCVSGADTNCLCAPNFDNQATLKGFVFQCNGMVNFGPKKGKVCPATVPVIKRVGVASINFTESSIGVPVPCNTTIHPTGYPGDESCGYSECESGGSFTALCGCVDFGAGSPGRPSGMIWTCVHSTCGCDLNTAAPTKAPTQEPTIDPAPSCGSI